MIGTTPVNCWKSRHKELRIDIFSLCGLKRNPTGNPAYRGRVYAAATKCLYTPDANLVGSLLLFWLMAKKKNGAGGCDLTREKWTGGKMGRSTMTLLHCLGAVVRRWKDCG
jgi:hypothetical protein